MSTVQVLHAVRGVCRPSLWTVGAVGGAPTKFRQMLGHRDRRTLSLIYADVWVENESKICLCSSLLESPSDANQKQPPPPPPAAPQGDLVQLGDLLDPPGRYIRPPRIVFILRGLPGSGKSHLAKAVKAKETELGSDPPRILSLDDYFECDGEVNSELELEDYLIVVTLDTMLCIVCLFFHLRSMTTKLPWRMATARAWSSHSKSRLTMGSSILSLWTVSMTRPDTTSICGVMQSKRVLRYLFKRA